MDWIDIKYNYQLKKDKKKKPGMVGAGEEDEVEIRGRAWRHALEKKTVRNVHKEKRGVHVKWEIQSSGCKQRNRGRRMASVEAKASSMCNVLKGAQSSKNVKRGY